MVIQYGACISEVGRLLYPLTKVVIILVCDCRSLRINSLLKLGSPSAGLVIDPGVLSSGVLSAFFLHLCSVREEKCDPLVELAWNQKGQVSSEILCLIKWNLYSESTLHCYFCSLKVIQDKLVTSAWGTLGV